MAGEKEGGEGTKKDELLLQSLSPFPLFLSPIQVPSPFHLLGETPWLKQVTWTRFNKVFRGPSSFISTYNDA